MKDPAKFDPIVWVDRLREVSRSGDFKPEEKMLIDEHLGALKKALEKLK